MGEYQSGLLFSLRSRVLFIILLFIADRYPLINPFRNHVLEPENNPARYRVDPMTPLFNGKCNVEKYVLGEQYASRSFEIIAY